MAADTRTPPDDTTETLRERLIETLNTTIVTPEGGIERSTSKFDRHDRHNFLHNCVACQGNVPAIVSTVLAALPGDSGDPGDLLARTAEAIAEYYESDESRHGGFEVTKAAAAALSVRSEHEAQLAGRWGDAIRRAELAETRMERMEEALRDAYAERDQQFERKVAALRERDEAKQQLAEAQRTIAAHERHINDTFEANRCGLHLAREQRDEAQDERDELKAKLAETERRRSNFEAAWELSKRDYQYLADQLFASCICDPNPETTEGMLEDCPVHGADEYRPLALRKRASEAEAERDRLRLAWQSARERAKAYGESITRLCEEREWCVQWYEQAEAKLAAITRARP